MSKFNPIISSFNAGELSPLVGGQPALAKYQAGLATCRNFIPRVEGALVRRGGTRFVAEAKSSTLNTRLARFVFAADDAFVLEFGDIHIRFFTDHGVLLLEAAQAWDTDTDYVFRDYVTDGGVEYFCIKANKGQQPPNAEYWRPAAWDEEATYAIADLVTHEGATYYCRVAHGPPPPENPHEHTPGANQPYWHAMSADGQGRVIYEVPTPYPRSNLTLADGSFGVRYTQSGDVIYLTHAKHQPQKLTRRGDTDWVMAPFEPAGGPFKDQNEDEAFYVTASASNVGDETTLILNHTDAPIHFGDVFRPGHVGGLFYLEMADGGGVKPWEVYQRGELGALRRSDGKYYECTHPDPMPTDQYTGTEKPIHTSGAYWDGDGKDKDGDDDDMGPIGVEWTYRHAGYGWVRITNVIDGHTAEGIVVSQLPTDVVTKGTWRWAMPAWSDEDGWPSSVAFFRDRLAFGQGQTVWFSQAGDYENFKARDFGETLPSSAFGVLVQSGLGDPVEWLAPAQRLLAGTGGSVHAIGEGSTSQPFAPANARQEDQVMPAASGVQPVSAGAVLYVEKSGRILNEAGFSAEGARFEAGDLTVFAEHITRSGIRAMAAAKQPNSTVWCVRADGGLVGLTFHRDQKVSGWHQQALGGGYRPSLHADEGPPIVEDVVVIPSPAVALDHGRTIPAGARDDVWLLVTRTIDGQPRRYIEYMTAEYDDGDDPALAAYSDCHLVYDGAPATVIGGLDHLAGCTVQVKADGAAHRDLQVVLHKDDPEDEEEAGDWRITLDAPAGKVVVGLAAPARARTLPLEAGATLGTSQARIKRVNRATFRLLNSLGGRVGPDFDALVPLEYRVPTGEMDAPPPIFTGDKLVEFPGDYDAAAAIAVECDQGFPFTLVAIMPELTTYEG